MTTTATPGSKPKHLDPSELGTKEYWDNLYTTELTNHASDPSDRGTVWFDDSDAEAKLLEFLDDQTTEPCYHHQDDGEDDEGGEEEEEEPLSKATTSFLDLGCGNGSLLAALRAEGWAGRALGVDYSEKSVALARQIHHQPSLPSSTAAVASSSPPEEGGVRREDNNSNSDPSTAAAAAATDEQDEGSGREIEFAAWDLLASPRDIVLSGDQARGWDVVLDKGTFDAISLSEARDDQGRRACEAYKGRVLPLVREGGLFLVTSCNWTEEELEAWFGRGSPEVDAGRFVRVGRVQYPSFSFGGVKGQTISTLCFQRR